MARSRTSLAGKAVLITGAARGIGAELARKAAGRGARVALVGLEPERLAALADELGPEHLWVEADVTDPEALTTAVQRTVDTFGGLDIAVANAGIAPLTTVYTASAHSLARTIEVNLIGSMLTAHAALPEVAKRKGHILLVSSAAAFTVLPGMSAYCAAKAGLERFGDALRLEVAHRGVTVASAHPTWIDTDLVRDTEEALPTFKATRKQLPGPLGAFTSVEVCAEALVENLETRRRRVFVPGLGRGGLGAAADGDRRARGEGRDGRVGEAGAAARARHRRAERPGVRQELDRRPGQDHARRVGQPGRMSRNTDTVERYLDGFRRSDHAQILSCLTDDIEWTVFGAFHLTGKQAYDEAIEGVGFTGPPRLDVVRMVEQDDVVMAELTGEATRDTGEVLRMSMAEVFVMRDGLIAERRAWVIPLTENDHR